MLVERAIVGDHLRHEISDGRAKGEPFLDDYAFLIAGLLDLFEVDPDPRWLRHAIALQARLEAHFADAARGGYFFTAAQGKAPLTPPNRHALGGRPTVRPPGSADARAAPT